MALCWLAYTLLVCAWSQAQSPFPANSTALPDHPYFIKKTWVIGGYGNWDYLTADPAANRLYIAHGAEVQVVDVKTGDLAGSVKGLREAHAVALDRAGEFGYVSDGLASNVAIFDRSTLKVVANVAVRSSPRALIFEPQTGLLLAVSAGPAGAPPPTAPPEAFKRWAKDERDREREQERQREQAMRNPANRQPYRPPQENPCAQASGSGLPAWQSLFTFIDPEARAIVAEVNVCGFAGPAVADGRGNIYAAIVNNGEILHIDAAAILDRVKNGSSVLDWREATRSVSSGIHRPIDGFDGLETMSLGAACRYPRALAIDGAHLRLFAACDNHKLIVLDSGAGQAIATLTIDIGPDSLGYDADRGRIYSANGGGDGTLTIIHQSVSDSYNVIQTLPTRQLARTLAVNSSTGEIYLVTAVQGVSFGEPIGRGVSSAKLTPLDSTFQVLVVGN